MYIEIGFDEEPAKEVAKAAELIKTISEYEAAQEMLNEYELRAAFIQRYPQIMTAVYSRVMDEIGSILDELIDDCIRDELIYKRL